ncbi:MAG: nitroreductase/quinone reductase family protein [Streptosporangiaceae bacterium]
MPSAKEFTMSLDCAVPTEQAPAGQSPAGQSPARQSPAGQTPASQTPASQTPASQTPASQAATVRPRSRLSVPRGLLAGTLVAAALVWGLYGITPGSSLRSALVQSGIYLGLLLLTVGSRRAKVLLVRTVQRYTINPLMRLLLAIGINPLGVAILETRGRVSGKIRRVPVGNGRQGSSFWIIAEHGSRAGYVRNIQHDPRPGAAARRAALPLGAGHRRRAPR